MVRLFTLLALVFSAPLLAEQWGGVYDPSSQGTVHGGTYLGGPTGYPGYIPGHPVYGHPGYGHPGQMSYGACMSFCQTQGDANAQFNCKLQLCGNLFGGGGPGGDPFVGGPNPGLPFGADCQSVGGVHPALFGGACPGGYQNTFIGGQQCCAPQGAGGFPGAGIPTAALGNPYGGPTCNSFAEQACVAQYNCPRHPESQGCFTFCRLQAGPGC